ncbi:MAG: hypothetical protein H0W96_17530, partial [Solirubrobacterales bacterium]|nr:hypothetical protein [Solirubrobacterales bacterium]
MTPSPPQPAPAPPPPFEPPGPGCWSLDTAHFPQPATSFVVELFSAPARRGFREATARYGLLLDYIEWAFVHRWAYLCPRPVWSTDDDREQMSRRRWDRLLSATPTLGERVATSARVFDDRRWREDARRWDERSKPDLRRAHLKLQAVDPSSLDAGGLCSHLDDCRRNLVRSIYHHHRLNTAPVLPAGDFLVHAQEWTGRPASELVALLRGGDAYAGAAAAERTSLTEALRADPTARRLLRAGKPGEVLAALLSRPGETGRATAAYANLVGDWTVGSGADVSEPRLLEMPQILLATIAAAAHTPPGAADATADLRADVPQGNRGAFDE